MVILGLGMVFYGMSVMSDGLQPAALLSSLSSSSWSTCTIPLLGAAVGMAFTALVQSSSATTGILIVMASQGLIALEPAIAIALGANIGTCVTAGLAVIGKPREAVRAAVVHTLFNVDRRAYLDCVHPATCATRGVDVADGRRTERHGPPGRRNPAPDRQRAHLLQHGQHAAAGWLYDPDRAPGRVADSGQAHQARRGHDCPSTSTCRCCRRPPSRSKPRAWKSAGWASGSARWYRPSCPPPSAVPAGSWKRSLRWTSRSTPCTSRSSNSWARSASPT